MKNEIELLAQKLGWKKIADQTNIGMISFVKFNNGTRARVNIYLTRKGRERNEVTVATAIDHPSKGRTQLYRRNCGIHLIKKILSNPRTHTGFGYYMKI